MDGLAHPNLGAFKIASTNPPMMSTSKKTPVNLQSGRKIMPMPAAISRKGQMCVSAQRLADGIFPDFTSSQMTPVAMSSNGPNIDLLFSMMSFFFDLYVL